MEDQPDLIISIVNTSNRGLLLQCLDSLQADSDRRAAVKIVVLDNASDDDSVEEVSSRFPDVRIITQPFRAGFGANHNRVIRETRSRYVYVLNEDTVSSPRSIDRMIEYLDAHPTVAVLGPRIVGPDGLQVASAWRLMSLFVTLCWAATVGQLGVVQSKGSAPRRVGAVSAAGMIVRREPFERIGLFDEDFFMFCEEADTAHRLGALGYEIHYFPLAEIIHFGQQSTAHVPEHQVNENWRSLRRYLRKYHPSWKARVLALLTAWGYAMASLIARTVLLLPPQLRPAVAQRWNPRTLRLNARNGFSNKVGPGIRELADEWNRRHPLVEREEESSANPEVD